MVNCGFFARHGVLDAEAELGQRFFLDVELTVDAPRALEEDAIAGTVHYGEAYAVVAEVVTERRFKLIEALAHAVGTALRARFPAISRAQVTVRKPSVPIAGLLDHAEVTVSVP
ncbi:MAG: dihydroneopterin aldolase [Mesorhizobium amorphae]|nr:MAG: dihydroneopterin aldolase [Mesorhizobium amorphae]